MLSLSLNHENTLRLTTGLKYLFILLLIPCATYSQKWTEQYDKFTKIRTWETETHRVAIKRPGGFLLNDDYLSVSLYRDSIRAYAYIGFRASFDYESLATKETKITFLYDNDSTNTVTPYYAKSSLMQLLGKAWYHTTLRIDVHPLQTPIKAIRIHLNEYNKDIDLKDDGTIGLVYFINKAVETMVKP